MSPRLPPSIVSRARCSGFRSTVSGSAPTARPGAASCCWSMASASSGSVIWRRCRRPAAIAPRASRGGWRPPRCMRWAAATDIARRFADEPFARPVRNMLARGVGLRTDHVRRPPVRCRGRAARRVAPPEPSRAKRRCGSKAWCSETDVLADGWRIDGGVLDLSAAARPACRRHGTGGRRHTVPRHADRRAGRMGRGGGAAHGLRTVALSGGCFLNKVLSEGFVAGLDGARDRAADRPRRAAERRRPVARPGLCRRSGAVNGARAREATASCAMPFR